MTNPKLDKTWGVARAHLRHARNERPEPQPDHKDEFERLPDEHHALLNQNELELALDRLEEIGNIVPCRVDFWEDLEPAAEIMNLHHRVPYFRKQFSAAMDRLGDKNQHHPRPEPPTLVRSG